MYPGWKKRNIKTIASDWYPDVYGSRGYVVFDNFNRADNASVLGTANTGQAWVPLVGTWGISVNQAYVAVVVGNPIAVVDSGLSNSTVNASIPVAGNDVGLVMRATDASNYIRFIIETNVFYLQKCVVGAFTTIASIAGTLVNGDQLSVSVSGSVFTAYKNGVFILTGTDAFNSSATKHGITAVNSTVRLDDFKVS